jgi:hypothetical protein
MIIATPPKLIWKHGARALFVRQTVAYSMGVRSFVSATYYCVYLQTLDLEEEYRFHIDVFHRTSDGKSRTQFSFCAPPDSETNALMGDLSSMGIATFDPFSYKRYRKVHLSGMPPDKIFTICKELEELLRGHEIPEPAIRHFIEQASTHLRVAIKSQQRKLAIPPAPADRWPRDRRFGETPVEFVRRVYGLLIDHGEMTQSDLASIDKKALEALRNYCGYRHARPKRPRASDVVPPSKKNPDDTQARYGKLTYQNSVAAWRRSPTRENLERKRAYEALLVRKSRARNYDPT